jgi:hypothetical protein
MRKSKIIICAIMVAMVSIFLVACCGHGESSAQSKTGTKTLNRNYVYEWIDKDTGVHYWVYRETAGGGGMTPRLSADGSVMVTVE